MIDDYIENDLELEDVHSVVEKGFAVDLKIPFG